MYNVIVSCGGADVCAPALFLCPGGSEMSAVTLLCADHSLPLYRSGSRRIRTAPSGPVAGDGFSVQTHKYYRQVVEELGLTMKPFQYELDLRATGEDAAQLRAYLETAPLPRRDSGAVEPVGGRRPGQGLPFRRTAGRSGTGHLRTAL